MAVKIRLQRHGKKNFAFFHIVVADSRAPRDGRYIEQIGSYNPNTNPATIVLDSERALAWLKVGAEPSLVARRILSYEGVLLRNHLDEFRLVATQESIDLMPALGPKLQRAGEQNSCKEYQFSIHKYRFYAF